MTARANAAPVIIKRKKIISGGGHHGGAWKVAYADFVTAMMAFFMLMWLLNATTEKQRKGIADYFSPTAPINRISGGGNEMFGGDSILKEQFLANNGVGGLPTSLSGGPQPSNEVEGSHSEQMQLAEVQDFLIGGGGESFLNDSLKKHVVTRLTDEGLVIELFDTEDVQLFVDDSDKPYRILVDLVRLVADASQLIKNDIAIEGHVRTVHLVRRERATWALSLDRADKVRELLETHGLNSKRLARVTGHADRKHITNDPRDPRNNRISVILLREN
ncbi:flagellar motor protein MotB [Shimia abyssi]|uniref:Chemotaxis protein MotB n=1 Tax=Shimia abyssi TaxID=1662395 RepID=A0A2P8EX54_9RHOB|nr:flagellar motor protein MotB [Shimia abyssi]PSL14047.1 chemotaxis protein MotB [Shimia abyssi]